MNEWQTRVLIIDDNGEIHKDFEKILGDSRPTKDLTSIESELFGSAIQPHSIKKSGCQITSALQGEEGFDTYRSQYLANAFDIVFVDMRMPPGWDGLRTIKEIWTINPDQFVVLCSAYSDYSFDALRRELGNRQNFLILAKPFHSQEVEQIVSSVTLRDSITIRSEKRLAQKLSQAIDQRELNLVFQPVLDLKTNMFKGFESLCRWSAEGNMVASPDVFVKIAEDHGRIHQLGDWVAREAIESSRLLSEATPGSNSPLVTFNVSVMQLKDSFVSKLYYHCQQHNVRVQDIGIEITESKLMDDVDECRSVLNELVEAGFDILIDDFGTGQSSLFTLFKLPYHYIKIDRLFTQDIVNDKTSRTIVKSMIDLCHDLGKEFVAEGVESQDQLDLLKELGCDFAQGYLIAKPLSLEDALYVAKFGVPTNRKLAA
jgi:EAL domain-containing protein (putative c-di-GMP-specific phosphodiesterase class I)